jgi:hypothetical protein
MRRTSRTNPRLQEKLDALQRELARVESDIKGISRAVEGADPEQVARKLRHVSSDTGLRDVPVVRTISPEPVGDESAAYQGLPPAAQEIHNIPLPKAVPDSRFTTYFGTGSLHSVRPLRQERRVQRNKAIFMLILAAAILYLVFSKILM